MVLALVLCASALGQSDLQPIFDAEKAFGQAAADEGVRSAYLQILADDGVIFRPGPVNGREFWESKQDGTGAALVRTPLFADIAANGMMGFVTGGWELYPKGRSGPRAAFGDYVTIWEKRADGKFKATLDIGVRRDPNTPPDRTKAPPSDYTRDPNRNGWSVADSAMAFLRTSMTQETLGGAYNQFAADDIRLLREHDPPIQGKKRVVSEMKRYTSVEFPKKVNLFQAADMAYVWNPCEFSNNNEGTVKGNCLQIWKLRDKKWWIVVSVFAPYPNDTPPVLKTKKPTKAKD